MDLPRQSTLLNQNFGLCIGHQDILIPCYYGTGTNYYRPWRWGKQVSEDYGSIVQNLKDKFQIILDIQTFKPNEISVKVANNEVIIEGKHDEREDDFGFVSRSFKRRYLLPNNCLEHSVESSMSSDGILKVTGFKNKIKENKEITVPIQVTASKMDIETVKAKNEVTQKSDDAAKLQCQEVNKKCTAIMIKDDHCCLLKPELLGKVVSTTEESAGKMSEGTKSNLNKEVETSSKTTIEHLDETEDCQQHKETSLTPVENIANSTTSKSESSQIKSPTTEGQQTSTSIESSASSSLSSSAKIYEIVCDISTQLKEAADNL